MRAIHIAAFGGLFTLSAALGLFFLGSAALAASGSVMQAMWVAWAVVVLAALVGVVFAIRKVSLAAVAILCVAPFAFALGAANLALRFGQ